MDTLKFYKTLTLPATFSSNSIYLHRDTEDRLTLALTDNIGGVIHTTPTTPSIESKLNDILYEVTGAANGLVDLSLGIEIPLKYFPGHLVAIYGKLSGPSTVVTSTTTAYEIVHYSTFKAYTVAASTGTVVRVDNIVYYTAPNTTQGMDITDAIPITVPVTLYINGTEHQITVVWPSPYITTPTITSPVIAATNLGPNVTITLSAFEVIYGIDTHASTDWEIATDSAFTNIYESSTADTFYMTSFITDFLQKNTTYYVRARYNGTTLSPSAYTPTVYFTTKDEYVANTEVNVLLTSGVQSGNNYTNRAVSIAIDGTRIALSSSYKNKTTSPTASNIGNTIVGLWPVNLWAQEAALSGSDLASNKLLSTAVDTDETSTRVVSGYPSKTSTFLLLTTSQLHGGIYIHRRTGTTWVQESIIESSDGVAFDRFGWSVGMTRLGDRVVAGAPTKSSRRGAAYIYSRSGNAWSEEKKIVASNVGTGDQFGYSVSISKDGTRLVSGAPFEDTGATNSGSIYVFLRVGTNWVEEQRIPNPFVGAEINFGVAVSMNETGTRLVAGASGAKGTTGEAYVYTRVNTTWSLEATLSASNGASGDQFGLAVNMAANGNVVIVGAPKRIVNGRTAAGAAYLYLYNGTSWVQEHILLPSTIAENRTFGASVAVSGDGSKALIGAAETPNAMGAVYVFS